MKFTLELSRGIARTFLLRGLWESQFADSALYSFLYKFCQKVDPICTAKSDKQKKKQKTDFNNKRKKVPPKRKTYEGFEPRKKWQAKKKKDLPHFADELIDFADEHSFADNLWEPFGYGSGAE